MYRSLIKLCLLCLPLVLTACADTSSIKHNPLERAADRTPNVLYQKAKESLANGNVQTAIEKLQMILSRYPFGPHVDQVQLDLIYAHYRTGDEAAAMAAVDRFIRLNPTHKDVDYALYMRGLINQSIDNEWFHKVLKIDRTDRDPGAIKDAFNDFAKLVKEHPNSKYAPDTRKRMLAIKERLANYEIEVAEYYISRHGYIAAVNRAKYVLEYYPDMPMAVERALEIMVQCYDILGLPELKQDSLAVLKANYPKNELLD